MIAKLLLFLAAPYIFDCSSLLSDFLDIEPEKLIERFDDKLIDNLHKFKGLEDE